MINKEHISAAYQLIQDEICAALEQVDGKAKFEEEKWEREGGGGGRTRIIQNGNIFERGGVNFSAVHGQLPLSVKKALNVDQDDFFATGISIVIHPNHPMVPIIHMNVRYFEMPTSLDDDDPVRWFGGGIDLTPHYIIDDDARYFHQNLKDVCGKFNHDFYHRFKLWADDYFYIKHRNETRGIGGIFYDRLTASDEFTWEAIFDFSKALGRSFIPVYTELVNRNRSKAFTEENKNWQYQRRSRYTEFNLVYDAGTKFGLETNGRIESILMSLPPTAKWVYNYQAQPGSEEREDFIVIEERDKLGMTNNWKILTGAFLLIVILSSFYQTKTLAGKWVYAGDIFNGKKENAPTEYLLERKYTDTGFTAYVLEKGYKPELYETGKYVLNTDTCLETQTWCSQPSVLVGIPVHYNYSFRKDTLVLHGILPNGAKVEEYWKKAK